MNSAEIIRRLEQVEKQQKDLEEKQRLLSEKRERLLKELAESMDAEKFTFDDNCRTVNWSSGKLGFQPTGWKLYCILKLLYEAIDEPLSFAEIAETVCDNPLADVTQTIYRLKHKLEENGFPKNLVIWKQTATLT